MKVIVEQDYVTPEIAVEDILVFDCGCACRVEALSHPGIENSLGYHMCSVCSLQELEIAVTYDTDTFDITGGYEAIYIEVAYSHNLGPEDIELKDKLMGKGE
jgi:hypothetical protein